MKNKGQNQKLSQKFSLSFGVCTGSPFVDSVKQYTGSSYNKQ